MAEVSVLTPCLNAARFIRDAVASVTLQEGVDVEHIVQDGGSQDETVALIEGKDARVKLESRRDRGQSDALNRALERAGGRCVSWLNGDEFYLPGALAALLETAERTGADVVYGDCVFVEERGRLTRLLPSHRFSECILRWYGPFIPSCAVLFRRDALGNQPWDVGLRRILDWDLYLSLAKKGLRFRHVAHPVAAFRLHPSQVTAQPASAFGEEYARVIRKHRLSHTRSVARRVGRLVHGALKALEGAYTRQARARRLRGLDLRWFETEQAKRNVARLVRECYGSRGPARGLL